jgi:DHA1 family bicyclomycin/chloramphenicol resistance-like MFS transporter
MLVVAGLGLVVIVSLPKAGLATVVAPLMLQMASWSFVQANALALALTDHPEVAGTAAALLGVSQYALGAVAAPLVGLGGSDTALPMATVIAVCAVGAAVAFEVLVSRPRGGSARIAEGTTAP